MTSHVTTKFHDVSKGDTHLGYYTVRKAENDDVMEITTYRYNTPSRDIATLKSIEYMSPLKAAKMGYMSGR